MLSEKDYTLLKKENELLKKRIEQHENLLSEKDIIIAKKDTAISEKDLTISEKEALIAKLNRMLFGQKRERFEHPDSQQLSLPFEIEPEVQAILEEKLEEKRQKVAEHERKKSTHKGRKPLPSHLEVVDVVIEPNVDTTEMICVGEETTEELAYQPEKLFIRRYIRKKYAPKSGEGKFAIGNLPERIIPKGIPSNELVSQILVDKYIDHLPLYRIQGRFARNQIDINKNTINGWVGQALSQLEILYDYLKAQVVAKGYLQVDETTLKVLDSKLKGKSHLGYYWVYHSPIDNILFFEYHPSREGKHVNQTLKEFKGYLQTDGYAGYHALAQKKDIKSLACMAHARRKFDEALQNDPIRAKKALLYIQALYLIEEKARNENLNSPERKELRLSESLTIINAFAKWMTAENKRVLPKSKIATAFRYSIERWDELSAYLYDGILEIDNNLIENAIRPIALGRKNYLFAGNHDAAQRSAMIYSFFGICKKHKVNPSNWLNFVFANIHSTSIQELHLLLPQNFKTKGM